MLKALRIPGPADDAARGAGNRLGGGDAPHAAHRLESL
jgi:hypothetical protein